jgi:hypothetical protein
MPPALDTITAQVTAAAAAGSAMAAVAGDSLIVRASPSGKRIMMLQAWADVQTAAWFQITSPRLHDNTRGLRFRTRLTDVMPLFPWPAKQDLYENDTLAIVLAGAAVAGDIETVSMLLYYEDLQGVNARFIDPATLKQRGVEMVTTENTLATGTTGGYSGGEAINAESDLLKANTDYALVGYRVGTECATVAWRGADTGNLRVSGPGNPAAADVTCNWFQSLSESYGIPLIPVFNSNNRAGITVDAVQDENGADVEVTSIFVRLA